VRTSSEDCDQRPGGEVRASEPVRVFLALRDPLLNRALNDQRLAWCESQAKHRLKVFRQGADIKPRSISAAAEGRSSADSIPGRSCGRTRGARRPRQVGARLANVISHDSSELVLEISGNATWLITHWLNLSYDSGVHPRLHCAASFKRVAAGWKAFGVSGWEGQTFDRLKVYCLPSAFYCPALKFRRSAFTSCQPRDKCVHSLARLGVIARRAASSRCGAALTQCLVTV